MKKINLLVAITFGNTRLLAFGISILLIFFACSKKETGKIEELAFKNKITIEGRKFINSNGNQVILHGINMVNKNPKNGYLGRYTQEDFNNLRKWGFNCVRLGIIWDGVEPEPGIYNEEYLNGVEEIISWAKDNKLYVFLDMHQDLYSILYSDGAPEWATIHEDKPHETGDVWSDSYLISPAVQTAFDNFWMNTPAEDGIGIQDHYANAWKHVAARFADEPYVIGFDIMNEPFQGSSANQVMPALLNEYAKIVAEETGIIPGEEELMMSWASMESRVKVLESLSDVEKYGRVINAMAPVSQQFEENQLAEMNNRVTAAIREVCPDKIVFIEHGYFSNTGIPSSIKPVVKRTGEPDALIAYGAHGYDLVTDTKAISNPSNDRVGLIFDQLNTTANRLDYPLLVGEWGAFGKNKSSLAPAQFIAKKFEETLASDTYWDFTSDLNHLEHFPALSRHYPMSISGELISYQYDVNRGYFYCEWLDKAENKEPSKFYLPELEKLSEDRIFLTPPADQIIFDAIPGTESGYLIIPSSNVDVKRILKFQIDNEIAWNYIDSN